MDKPLSKPLEKVVDTIHNGNQYYDVSRNPFAKPPCYSASFHCSTWNAQPCLSDEEEYPDDPTIEDLKNIMETFDSIRSKVDALFGPLSDGDKAIVTRWMEEIKKSYDEQMITLVARAISSTEDAELLKHRESGLHPDFQRLDAAHRMKSTLLFDGLSGKKHTRSEDPPQEEATQKVEGEAGYDDETDTGDSAPPLKRARPPTRPGQ